MTEDSSEHSDALQEYIDIDRGGPFEFERLGPDDDGPLSRGRLVLDDLE